jgi:hypothetical protein
MIFELYNIGVMVLRILGPRFSIDSGPYLACISVFQLLVYGTVSVLCLGQVLPVSLRSIRA